MAGSFGGRRQADYDAAVQVLPLEPEATPALAALGVAPDAWLAAPSGRGVHAFGAWVSGSLVAAAELTPQVGPRRRHIGALRLAAADDARGVAEVIAAACALADDWLGLTRLELELAADLVAHHAALTAAGFGHELTRPAQLARGAGFVDAVGVARLRPGWAPAPPAPAPPWPARRAPPATVRVRAAAVTDAPAIAAMMREPLVTRGTLQVPSTSAAAWAPRLAVADGWVVEVAEVDGVPHVAGHGGLHVGAAPSAHVGMFGMAIATAWQGAGLGHALLARILDDARARGLRRMALEVYADNARARALYAGHGFTVDGVRRAAATCAGGYADAYVMSRAL